MHTGLERPPHVVDVFGFVKILKVQFLEFLGTWLAAVTPAATAGGKSISEDDAKAIAIKAVPGKVINVAVEKLKGVNRYVVEVVPTAGGKEWDVIVDMTNGKVIGIEK